jgi:hypothetical protein
MQQMRKERGAAQTVFIAGPFELARPGQTEPDDVQLEPFVRALQKLSYELVVLAPNEARLLKKQDIAIPEEWTVLGSQPKLVTLEKAGLRLGVLILPVGERSSEKGLDFLRRTFGPQTGRDHEPVDLLVAISPWGWKAEKDFLRQAPPGIDVFAGSNHGPYETGRFFGPGRILWIRPYSRGKALMQVSVHDWPKRDEQTDSKPSGRLEPGLEVIKSSIPRDPDIGNLFN